MNGYEGDFCEIPPPQINLGISLHTSYFIDYICITYITAILLWF